MSVYRRSRRSAASLGGEIDRSDEWNRRQPPGEARGIGRLKLGKPGRDSVVLYVLQLRRPWGFAFQEAADMAARRTQVRAAPVQCSNLIPRLKKATALFERGTSVTHHHIP